MISRIGVRSVTLVAAALLAWPVLAALAERRAPQAERVVEIRSYNLKAGTRDRFHALFLREALPMLRRWKVDVVAYGPSLTTTIPGT